MENVAGMKEPEGKTRYSLALVFLKWITGIIEFGGGVYILMKYHLLIGIVYAAYVAVAGALILPLSSCVNCYYFGKRCHCGWGYVTSLIHKKGNNESFAETFPWRILIYPVWAIPILAAVVTLGRSRTLYAAIFLAVYLLIIFIHHRLLMKRPACKVCRQRFNCPGCQYREYISN